MQPTAYAAVRNGWDARCASSAHCITRYGISGSPCFFACTMIFQWTDMDSNGPLLLLIGPGTAVRLLVIVAVDPLDRGVLDEADDPLGDFLDLLLRHVQRLA